MECPGYSGSIASRIFISYARSDQEMAEAVARQLGQLETAGQAEVWFDRELELGESWERRIMDVVQRADVVLLLLSPAYLASSFVSSSELPAIAQRGEQGARVVPVIIAPCNWKQHPYIGSLQAFSARARTAGAEHDHLRAPGRRARRAAQSAERGAVDCYTRA